MGVVLAGTAPGQAVKLQPFGRGAWQALRQAHAGQPTVVHFWGLTCGPCLAELPAWGKLARERPDANLVTIAADPAPSKPASLLGALSQAGLSATENWMFDGFSQRLRYEVDPAWQGELPMTVLIDANGAMQATVGLADLAEVRNWLDVQQRTRPAAVRAN